MKFRHSFLIAVSVTAIFAYCYASDQETKSLTEQSANDPSPERKEGVAVKHTGAVPGGGVGDLAMGKQLYAQVCFACHGEHGEGKEELNTPSIGGLPAWYIIEQLEKFKAGMRGMHPEDVPGVTMRAITLGLDDQVVKSVAEYVTTLPERFTEAPDVEKFNLEKARYRYANECMECHRYNGRGEIAFHSASLITLNRSYLLRQLKNYREGRRGADSSDMYGNKMVEQARRMSDDDIEMFVDYLGALAAGDDPRPARER